MQRSNKLSLVQALAFIVPWFSLTSARLVNVTLDDTFSGAIAFKPVGAWNDGRLCQGCTAHPSEDLVYMRSWHDSTFNPLPGSNDFPNQVLSAYANFNGTAVYVQCILARTTSGPTGHSDMSFYIDDQLVGTFVKEAPGTDGYDYGVTVYSNTSVPPGEHILRIENGHVNGLKSLLMLDSITYTYDDDAKTNSTTHASSTTTLKTSSSSTFPALSSKTPSFTSIGNTNVTPTFSNTGSTNGVATDSDPSPTSISNSSFRVLISVQVAMLSVITSVVAFW